MPWNKRKSYNLLKSNKEDTAASGSYTKKTETKKSFAFFKQLISKFSNRFNIKASKTG